MPDIFDQVAPGQVAPAPAGDVFDQVALSSSPVPNQDKTASLPTPPPTSLAEKAKAALALGIAAGRMLPSGFGFGVQPNARQQVAEGVNNIMDFAGHKAVDAANYVAMHGGFRPGGYDQPPFKYGQPVVHLAEPLTPEEEQSMPAPVAGVYGAVGEAANSLTTPEMVATLPAMALRPVLGAMALQGAVNLPEQVDQTAQTIGDPNQPSVEKWKAGARLGLNVGMTGLMGAGALRGAPKPPVLAQFKGDIFDRLNPTPPPTEQPSTTTPNAIQVKEAANVPTDQPTSDIPQVEAGVRPQDQGQGTGGQGDEASQVVDFQHELNNVATLLNGHKAKLTPDLFDSLTAQGDEAFNTAQTDLPAAREAVAQMRDQLRQAVSSPNTQTQGAPGADVVNPESGAQKPAASALGGLTREGLDKEELLSQLNEEIGQDVASKGATPPKTGERIVPILDKTTQSSIGSRMREAVEKNRESGAIPNIVRRNPTGASSALATTGVMDDVTFGSRVARVGTALTGTNFPKHAEVSEKATNALAAYGVARDAAPVMGEHMATDVLGPKWKDQNFNKLLDAVIVQDQLANLKAQHVAKGDAAMAARVKDVWNMPGSPLRDEAQYRALLKNPDVVAAIARHKATIQPFAEMMHVDLGGKLREGGKETGAFTNLVAILNPEDVESVKDMIYGSRRGNLTNPFKRGSAFTKQAKGTAQSYQFDYRKTAERMIRGNYEQYTLQKYYKTMEAEGLGFEAQAGGKAPVSTSGRPLKKVEIVRKGTGPGVTYRKNFWIRPDLHPELMRALGTDQRPVSGVTSVLLDAATDLQIIGPMDLLSHTANMFGTVASSPGGRGVLYDAVRLNTPVGLVDTAFRLGYNFLQALHNSPEVQKHIADYTQIGAGRAKPVHRGGLLSKPVAYVTGLPLETVQKFDPFHYANQFTAGLLKNVDKAGRITLNKMFDELVSRGWEKPSDLNRREFINRMGQYNSRLMPYYQQWMRERGLSPFVVAGVTMNRNALFRLIGNPQIRGANPQAWAKMVSVTALGTLSMVYAMPMVLNQLTVGNWKGRPGTQIGQIDTGKNDKQGRPIVVDPLQLLLLRRGLRISGINAIDRGQKEDLGAKRTAKEVIKDISAGILHPWIGPAPRFLYHAAAGREPAIPTQEGFMLSKNPHDPAENLVAALKHANPTLSSIFKGQEEGTGAVQEPMWNVLNPMGVKRGRLPSWSEKTTAAIAELAKTDPSLAGKTSIDQLSIGQRAKLQRLMNAQKTPASDYAMRAGAEKNLWENFAKQDALKGALKPDQQKWLADKKLTLSGFEAEITRGGTRLPATRQEGEFMQQAVAQEYQKAIEKLMQSPRNITQKILDERLTQARLRARAQLTRQMRASAVPK